ncbi:MAG: hypothetical protein NT069_04060 [Planctomycetota bacterium]|nr:hypothetical protein [Planctomycetota bacterium]
MVITHTNRKGTTYYLHEKRSAKGAVRYCFSASDNDTLVESIPDGYEIYEKPDSAQVFLRKVKPRDITVEEQALALRLAKLASGSNSIVIDVEKNKMEVYFGTPYGLGLLEEMTGVRIQPGMVLSPGLQSARDALVSRSVQFEKMLRFTLYDKDNRLFTCARWCFRGSIDGWVRIGSQGTLEQVVTRFAKHLGRESFYELI